MHKQKIARLLLGGLILLGAAVRSSGLEGGAKDAYRDNFDDSIMLDWEPAPGTVAETAELDNNSVLHIRGTGEIELSGRKFGYYVLNLRIREHGGVRVGGWYTIMLTHTDLNIIEKKGKSASVPLKIIDDDNKIFRNFSLTQTHDLKIIFAPSFLRVEIDGQKEFEKTISRPPGTAPIALIAEGNGAFFDDLRINPTFSLEEGTKAIPVAKNDALMFDCAQEISLDLQAANHTQRELDLIVSVCPFNSVRLAKYTNAPPNATIAIFGADRRYCSIEPQVDKRVASGVTKVKPGDKAQAIQVPLGKVPRGFYMLDIAFADGTNRLNRFVYPFAANSGIVTSDAALKEPNPLIYIGAYTALMPNGMKELHPLWWQTYLHATAELLKRHNLNVVVEHGGFDANTKETFRRYGVFIMKRGFDATINHPAVIGTLIGDEPSAAELDYYIAQYEEAHKATDKPVSTCCIGGYIGIGGKYRFWEVNKPKLRIFRWYQVKKHFYGIQHPVIYKGGLPLSAELRCTYEMFDTPCWIIPPALGGTEHEAYFQYPSPEETRGIVHLSMAYGLKGILFYMLQDLYGMGLINAETLEPHGGNLAAAGEVATYVQKHAALLCSLKVGKLDVRCESADIDPVPLHDGQDGRYVYVINRNTKERFAGRLFWPKELKRTQVEDIYAGKKLATQADEFYTSINLELAPGDGTLLAVRKEN